MLDKVMDLAKEGRVEASEDVFAANGMKLIAKGAKISVDMQERLLLHRLKKPLEHSMCVEDAVDFRIVVTEGERLADEVEAFRPFLGPIRKGVSPLQILAKTELNNALKMLLTLVEHGGPETLRHYIAVSLVGFGLAHCMGASERLKQIVTIGGMFHDAGELYINPEILRSGVRLKPEEWKHIFSHPVIGQKLIAEVAHFDPAVATAMLEHHERYNGNGYPRRLAGTQISFAGQILGVAETVTGLLLHKERSLERAEIAIKVIPNEYAPEIVSAVSAAVREARLFLGKDLGQRTDDTLHDKLNQLTERLAAAAAHAETLVNRLPPGSVCGRVIGEIGARLTLVERAFTSTGLNAVGDDPAHNLLSYEDVDIAFEIGSVIDEVEWRIKEVRRDLVIRSGDLSAADTVHIEPLLELLDTAPLPK